MVLSDPFAEEQNDVLFLGEPSASSWYAGQKAVSWFAGFRSEKVESKAKAVFTIVPTLSKIVLISQE